jgi:EAL domain-containing protein (putative c-di-GMP-specific phosphodiesterase class I)
VVARASGRVVAAEALRRWQRGGESIPPTRFIPVAERTGLILPIGWWALRTACVAARDWHRRYGVAVTVNVSALQLRVDDFADRVLAALGAAGLPGTALIIELTESILIMADGEGVDSRAARVLRRLRDHGVRVALDDFGTGYSALSYLLALPVDILKLDRAFIASPGTPGPRRYAVAGAVLQLAAGLGLTTIAEGVETAAQALNLRRLDCPLAQGFLYSPAVPPDDLDTLLARWNPEEAEDTATGSRSAKPRR